MRVLLGLTVVAALSADHRSVLAEETPILPVYVETYTNGALTDRVKVVTKGEVAFGESCVLRSRAASRPFECAIKPKGILHTKSNGKGGWLFQSAESGATDELPIVSVDIVDNYASTTVLGFSTASHASSRPAPEQ